MKRPRTQNRSARVSIITFAVCECFSCYQRYSNAVFTPRPLIHHSIPPPLQLGSLMRPGCLVALGNNMFRHRPQLTLSLSLLSLLLYLLFGEVGVHTAYSWGWAWPTSTAHHPHVPLDPTITDTNDNYRVITATSEETISSTKILVLADPHIQCSFDRYEPWLFRLDSDWYVGRAVSRLVARLQPHVVVVVGDVFAEGYKASEFEWQDYLQVSVCFIEVPPTFDFTHTHTHTHTLLRSVSVMCWLSPTT